MNETRSEALYSELLQVLQEASLYEIRMKQFMHESKYKAADPGLLKQIDDMATSGLPSLMGKLINRYELHTAFLALARYIRSFGDAAYVIEKIAALLTDRMAADDGCSEVKALITETGKYMGLVDTLIK